MTQFLKVYPINGPNQDFQCTSYSKPTFEFLFNLENSNVVVNTKKSKFFVELFLDFADDTSLWKTTGVGETGVLNDVGISNNIFFHTVSKGQRKQFLSGYTWFDSANSNNSASWPNYFNTIIPNATFPFDTIGTTKTSPSDYCFFQEFMWNGTHTLFDEVKLTNASTGIIEENLTNFNLLTHVLMLQQTEDELSELNRKYGYNPLLYVRGPSDSLPQFKSSFSSSISTYPTKSLNPFVFYNPTIYDIEFTSSTQTVVSESLIGDRLGQSNNLQKSGYGLSERFILSHMKPIEATKPIFFPDFENDSSNTRTLASIAKNGIYGVNQLEDGSINYHTQLFEKYDNPAIYRLLTASKQNPAKFQVPLLFQKFKQHYVKFDIHQCSFKTANFYNMFAVKGVNDPVYPTTLHIFNPYFELCLESLPTPTNELLSNMLSPTKSISTYYSNYCAPIPINTNCYNFKITDSILNTIDRILIVFIKTSNIDSSTSNLFELQSGAPQGWINANEIPTYLDSYQFKHNSVSFPQLAIKCGPSSRAESINHIYDVFYDNDTPTKPLINQQTYYGITRCNFRARVNYSTSNNHNNIGFQDYFSYLSGSEYMFMIGYNFGFTPIDLSVDSLNIELNFKGQTTTPLTPFYILFGDKNIE